MLTKDRASEVGSRSGSFCWSCGDSDPGIDRCSSCDTVPYPRPLARSTLIGAMASVRQKLRTRSGIVVAETPDTAWLTFVDASLSEVPKAKLSGVTTSSDGHRSDAWTLVSASRRIQPSDRRKFDDVITSFVLRIIDRSLEEARGFALDALDADCPAWLDKIHLTTTERDFLFASYHADRGNTAMALERLLQLPPDRYPAKDLVFLRSIGAVQSDPSTHPAVLEQLRPFADRPIAQAIAGLLSGAEMADETLVGAAAQILARAPGDGAPGLPASLVSSFLNAATGDDPLPAGASELGGEVRTFALAAATRAGGQAPLVTLSDLSGAPEALLDDAIELGVLRMDPSERQDGNAKYVLARTDPDVLTHEDLVALDYRSELARRAFLRGDRAGLEALPSSRTVKQLVALDDIRRGELRAAVEAFDAFEGQARAKVEGVVRSLEQGSLDEASNEVLTDGTTWPVLAGLLPTDTTELNSLSADRPTLRGIASWRSLSGALTRLWDWDWEGAEVEAKRCLMVARDEETRDEALNLIACAEWQLGDDADAIAALSSALEGGFNEGLQINMGVVAAALEPRLAGEHLGKLAMEAPTLPLRSAAASRALDLWYADPDPWAEEDGEHALPGELRDALRLLVRSDIDEASFVRFVRTMSRWDDEWLAAERSLTESPHASSQAAAVYGAKARDFESFVKALGQVVVGEGAPQWAIDERDALVGSAISALDPEDANPMAASFGLLLIDNELPMDTGPYVDLVAFTIVAICNGIDPEEGEPKERFIDLVAGARARLPHIPSDEQSRSGRVCDFAASALARSIAAARAHQYDQVVDLFNDLGYRLRGVPSYQVNRGAVRSATQPAMDFLSDTLRLLERLLQLIPNDDFKPHLVEFRDTVRQLQTAFNRVRG